jgi:hypothetical protein
MSEATVDLDRMREASLALIRAMEAFRYETPAELMQAVQEYAEVAAAINSRLRAAHVLLRQGRTAEALHACEAEPNVLDCIAELDAADQAVDAWRATLDEIAVACPERLLSDAAAELNAAYDIKHQLAHLMRTHRLLAISQGPLEDRVATLRAIANLNPENPVWIEDLAAYEEQCKKELEAEIVGLSRVPAVEVTEAVVARAKKIVKELSAASWQEPLPAQSVHRAEEIVARFRTDLARLEMDSLAARIVAAYADGALERAEPLCDRWEKCEKRVQLGPDHALSQQTIECREWVRASRAERQAAAELQAAMEEVSMACGMPAAWTPWQARPIRDRLHAAVHDMEVRQLDALPNDEAASLSVAARQRLQSLDRVPLGFYSLVGAAAVVLASGFTFAGGSLWKVMHRTSVIKSVREELDTLASEERFAEARNAWRKAVDQHPWIAEGTQYQLAKDIKNRFAEWEEAASEGLERVEVVLEDTRQSLQDRIRKDLDVLEETTKADGIIPSAAFSAQSSAVGKLDSLLRDLENAESDLNGVEKRRSADTVGSLRVTLQGLRDDVDQTKREAVTKIKRVWETRTQSLARALIALKQLKDDELAERKDDLKELRQRVDDVEKFSDRRQELLRDDITSLDERIDRVMVKKELRQQLTAAAGRGLDDYMQELTKRKAALSEGLIRDAEEVEASRPSIEAALAWSGVGEAWLPRLRGSKAEVAKLRDLLTNARSLDLQPTGEDAFEERLDLVLAVLEDADRNGDKTLQALSDYLANSIMQPDVLKATVEAGYPPRVYYTRATEKKVGGYFYTENQINPATRKLASLVEAQAIAAPHAVLADGLRASVEAVRAGRIGVEESLLGMIESVAKGATAASPRARGNAEEVAAAAKLAEVDPLLACRLLTMMADAACSRVMLEAVEGLAGISDRIAAAGCAEPEWIDPQKRKSHLEPDATKALEDPGILRAVGEGRDRLNEITARPAQCRSIIFAGWIEKAGTETIVQLLPSFKANASGPIFVIVPEGETSWKLVEVGRLADGKVNVTKASATCFGRPVFLEPAGRPAATRKDVER